jgi:hypothetical protein
MYSQKYTNKSFYGWYIALYCYWDNIANTIWKKYWYCNCQYNFLKVSVLYWQYFFKVLFHPLVLSLYTAIYTYIKELFKFEL